MAEVTTTPKGSKTKVKTAKLTSQHDGEMELKSTETSLSTTPKKKKSSRSKSPGKNKSALYTDSGLLEGEDPPRTPKSTKSKFSLASPKATGHKDAKLPQPPNSAPGRQSRSKSPGKLKSKRGSSVGKYKPKERSGSWWNLDDPNKLFLPDSDDEKKLSPEEIQRRNEEVQKFRDKYEEEIRSGIRTGLVSHLLNEAKQKERESKPVVLPNVRATPLKIDVSKFEPPAFKREPEQKALLKETAKKNFILKDFVNTGAKTDIRKLVKAFESVEVKNGANIVSEGDEGDHFFVVEHGTVEFQVNNKTVRTAGVGSTFGERNLLYQAPWNETVVASSNGKILRLHHNTYRGIMQTTEEAKKPPPTPPKKAEKKEDEYGWLVDSKAVQEMNSIKAALKKFTKCSDDLEKIKVLGEGQFGEVWLVATDLPGVAVPAGKMQHEFALKIQNKMGDDEKMIANIRSEIMVMQELLHPFISSLYTTYESEDSIDMLLGLIPGGELWDVVHKENQETGEWLSGIPETHAQFYSMVVADTLSFMHSQGFVFRDLKPENIMIDAEGYPMIVDFGFAKKCPNKTYTFCGTPNYVAPEIIKNAGHNAAADWWALGIVIYEMISGENPFFYDGLEQMQLFESIVEDPPEPLKEGFSKSVVNIVDKLLTKDPEKRLGSGKKKGKEVLNHTFFAGMNLKRLRMKKVKAPWIPGQNKDANQKEFEAELENERKAAIEAQASEQAEEERRRLAEQNEAIRQAEEEARLLDEQKAQKQRELEEQRQRMLEEEERSTKENELRLRLQREEEERMRLKEAQRLQAEEELRQQTLREEQERRRLEEERFKREAEGLRLEEARKRQEEEAEKERFRIEALERLQREEEERERIRLEEEEHLRKKEAERRRLEEEERMRREEERERLRLERLAEEERMRREEERERSRLEEEKRRRRMEEEAEEERLRKEEERERSRLEEDKRRRRMEEEEREKEKAHRKEERRKLKELEKQRAIEREFELERQREAAVHADTISDDEGSLDDVLNSPNRIANLEESWSEAVASPLRSGRRKKADSTTVPKGIVRTLVSGHGKGSTSPSSLYSPRVKDELNKSIGKGLVRERLNMAKAKEKMSGSVPSMFSNFQL